MDASAKPVFSIIIPTKNEEKQIEACLERVFRQEIDAPYEVILVDSSTNPHTREIAAQLGATVIHEPRPGKGLAAHTGARAARGAFLCFTEADCRVTPHWLSAIQQEFQEHPEAAAIASDYDFHDAGWFLNLVKSVFLPISIWGYYLLYRSHSIRGTNFAVRASIYRQAGEFSLQAREFQDVELGLRLRKYGPVRFVRGMKITTSARRIQGRMFKFVKEFTPAIFRLLVLKKIPEQATYEDVR
jgi:glycosyltransferase involved in cell wall biosynthesis